MSSNAASAPSPFDQQAFDSQPLDSQPYATQPQTRPPTGLRRDRHSRSHSNLPSFSSSLSSAPDVATRAAENRRNLSEEQLEADYQDASKVNYSQQSSDAYAPQTDGGMPGRRVRVSSHSVGHMGEMASASRVPPRAPGPGRGSPMSALSKDRRRPISYDSHQFAASGDLTNGTHVAGFVGGGNQLSAAGARHPSSGSSGHGRGGGGGRAAGGVGGRGDGAGGQGETNQQHRRMVSVDEMIRASREQRRAKAAAVHTAAAGPSAVDFYLGFEDVPRHLLHHALAAGTMGARGGVGAAGGMGATGGMAGGGGAAGRGGVGGTDRVGEGGSGSSSNWAREEMGHVRADGQGAERRGIGVGGAEGAGAAVRGGRGRRQASACEVGLRAMGGGLGYGEGYRRSRLGSGQERGAAGGQGLAAAAATADGPVECGSGEEEEEQVPTPHPKRMIEQLEQLEPCTGLTQGQQQHHHPSQNRPLQSNLPQKDLPQQQVEQQQGLAMVLRDEPMGQLAPITDHILRMPYEDVRARYSLGKHEIGAGRFGSIRTCLERATGRVFACKTIDKKSITCMEDAEDVRREVAFLARLQGHPHIVNLQSVMEDHQVGHGGPPGVVWTTRCGVDHQVWCGPPGGAWRTSRWGVGGAQDQQVLCGSMGGGSMGGGSMGGGSMGGGSMGGGSMRGGNTLSFGSSQSCVLSLPTLAPPPLQHPTPPIPVLSCLTPPRPHVFPSACAQSIRVIMELCAGGDLFDCIKARGQLSERTAALVLKALMGALMHCHAHGILHRDVKPENILMADRNDDSKGIKLIDFGVATSLQQADPCSEVAGTPEYMAPEVLDAVYGVEADIWSAGVVLYVILSGVPPFWASTNRTLEEAIRRKKVDFKYFKWAGVSDDVKELIMRMLKKNPRSRITAEQVLNPSGKCGPFLQPVPSALIEQLLLGISSASLLSREYDATRLVQACQADKTM
ncbi:unnamed protein product [Closterium sp. Yama58-4]|nr:unnamed protein product [Closterium sp. Yama58-4]